MNTRFGLMLAGFWLYLAALVVLWKTYPSPLMNVVFFVGAGSMFATGAIYLYRLRKQFKR